MQLEMFAFPETVTLTSLLREEGQRIGLTCTFMLDKLLPYKVE